MNRKFDRDFSQFSKNAALLILVIDKEKLIGFKDSQQNFNETG